MISEAEWYDNDQLKKNFLMDKLKGNGQELLIDHKTFSECIEKNLEHIYVQASNAKNLF